MSIHYTTAHTHAPGAGHPCNVSDWNADGVDPVCVFLNISAAVEYVGKLDNLG